MTVACPKLCGRDGFGNPGQLAGHLIEEHLMAGSAALALVRQTAGEVRAAVDVKAHQPSADSTAPSTKEKSSMAGTCKLCEKPGHNSRTCPDRAKDGTARVGGGSPAKKPRAAKKRKPITRRHPLAPSKNGTGLVTEISALGSVASALEPLDVDQRKNVLGCICKLLAIDPAKLAAA